MMKKMIVSIVVIITIGVIEGVNYLNFESDNSVEKENVLSVASIEKRTNNTLDEEVNEIKESLNSTIEENVTPIDKENNTIAEKTQENYKKESSTKTNVSKNNTQETGKTQEKAITTKNEITQEKNNNKTENTQKIEENKTKEPIYNQAETNRMIASIDKFAKQNPDLIGKNGEKLYKIRISKDAMQFNCFYPFRESQIEAKVANVYPCTFVIYAVDLDAKTKYYIGIE